MKFAHIFVMFDSLTLSDLAKRQKSVLRDFSSTRPAVWLVEENNVRAIVKDFSVNKFFFRNFIGRFLVWREVKAYKRLNNLRGVPKLFRVISGLALVIEEIPAIDMDKIEKNTRLPAGFYDELKDLVDRFHERGLVHCDLKRAPNILIGHDGHPYVIDWGAAISNSECCIPPLNFIFRRFVLDDYNAIIKRKLRHNPELVSPEEKEKYNHQSLAEKTMRALRDRLRNFLQKVV